MPSRLPSIEKYFNFKSLLIFLKIFAVFLSTNSTIFVFFLQKTRFANPAPWLPTIIFAELNIAIWSINEKEDSFKILNFFSNKNFFNFFSLTIFLPLNLESDLSIYILS